MGIRYFVFYKRACCVRCKEKRSYWLDKADDKYSSEFREGIQAAFHVMILFIPIPIFWALYDQQVKMALDLFQRFPQT